MIRAAACLCVVLAACGDSTATDPDASLAADAADGDAVAEPDAAQCPDPPAEKCDFFLSCGCDTASGQKCTGSATGPACGPAGGSAAGAECTLDSECPAGTLCAPNGGVKQCLPFCDFAHPCTLPSTACYVVIADQDGVHMGKVCGTTCALLAQDCPYDTQGCYPMNSLVAEAERGVCAKAGTGVQGTTCSTSNQCAEGFLCTGLAGGSPVCGKLCDRNAATPCEGSLTCRFLQGHSQTGVCL